MAMNIGNLYFSMKKIAGTDGIKICHVTRVIFASCAVKCSVSSETPFLE
jgi:hypothetical protein